MIALWHYLVHNRVLVEQWARTTAWLTVVPLAIGFALALPTGWLATRRRWAYPPIVGLSGGLYTIPSVVMFLILPSIIGTKILDPINVGVALTIYAYALMVRTVADALLAVSPDVLDAADAMGETSRQRFFTLQLPLATPVIAAGARVAAVSNISLISVASIIGVPQLGELFTLGNNTESITPIVLGLIFFLLLAFAVDLILTLVARSLTPWHRLTAQ